MAGFNDARKTRGQAMVEFALIILVLMFLIFVIIEGARILQANLTAQNAARAAGRYAITGQYDPTCLTDTPPCPDPRVASIKAKAREELAGLPLADDAAYEDPNYYLIEVIGTDEDGNQIPGYAGAPGMPVVVRVTYRVGMVTPLVEPIASTVRVIGQVVLNNERFTQISNTSGGDEAPDVQILPTAGPSPTPSPPDLTVNKSVEFDPVIEGEEFEYTIDVVNQSETDATGVQVIETFPPGIEFRDGPCTPDGGSGAYICDVGDIEGQLHGSITIVARANSNAGDSVTNEVEVDYPGDPVSNNNTASVTHGVIATPTEADLGISKGASSSLVSVGTDVVFSMSVLNHGPADATNAIVSDALPAGFDFVSVNSSQGACSESNGTVTCELGEIARSDSATVSIRTTAAQVGEYTNTASVSGDGQPEPPGATLANSDSATVRVQNTADMGVTKSASPNPGVGEEMTYSVNVFNNGPAAATNTQVVDSLPPSVDFVSATPSQGSCSESGNVVTCALGSIANGSGATVDIVVVPTEEKVVRNEVSVGAAETDPYSPNDSFALDTTIQPRADLAITKVGPTTAVAGETISYTVTVVNNGPSTARGVFVNDTLPANVSFVTAAADSPSEGTCSGNNSTVTCGLGSIPSGDRATVTIWIIPQRGGEITNWAEVTSNTVDPDPSNNRASAGTTVDGSRPYIIVSPICGDPGTQINVSGYNWQPGSPYDKNITISWDGNQIASITANSTWQTAITIPDGANMGDHLVEAFQGRSGNQAGITADTTVAVPCPAPNLIVSEPELISPTQPIAGEPLTFRAEVSNVGNEDAVSQFFVGLYFDPTPAPALGSDTYIDQSFRAQVVAVNGLAVSASKTVTFTVEDGFETDGAHEVYAVADSDPAPYGVIDVEHDEADNISTSLVVEADPAPTATPTPTATPGAGGTATATPAITPTPSPTSAPGSLAISVFNQQGQPQANTELTLIDESDGSVVDIGHTGSTGTYLFQNLAPGTYTVTACITIENVDYYSFVTGIVIESGTVTQRVLFLEEAPGGCT